jgi:hypothetical protein
MLWVTLLPRLPATFMERINTASVNNPHKYSIFSYLIASIEDMAITIISVFGFRAFKA